MYRIVFTKRALKDLEKIPQNDKIRIAKKLKEFSRAPLNYSRKLTNPIIGSYRFRIGNYRIVFDIEKNDIAILRIGLRKNIYK